MSAKPKTRKAILERVKITARGKLLRRVAPIDHFRTSKPNEFARSRRRTLKPLSKKLIKGQIYY